MRTILILPLLAGLVCAQTQTGPASTKGSCSHAISGNNDTLTINCGIGREQGDKLIAILNTILSNRIDPDAVMSKLDDIQKNVDAIKQNTAHRRLAPQQEADLAAALLPMAGHKVGVVCVMGDTEGKDFAMDFVETFRDAHWLGMEDGVSRAVWDRDPVGIRIQVSEQDVVAGTVPAEAQAIFDAVKSALRVGLPGMKGTIPRGDVNLIFGKKP